MSLKGINEFLNSELNEVNDKIRNINKLIKDNNLRIDEANYFINELSGKSSDLSSSYVSEKNKNEKLSFEKSSLDECLKLKAQYDEELKALLSKKDSLEKYLKSLDKSVESKSASREKASNLKNEIKDIISDINSANEFLSKSIKQFSYQDPNRVVTDYNIFNNRLDDVIKKIESLEK